MRHSDFSLWYISKASYKCFFVLNGEVGCNNTICSNLEYLVIKSSNRSIEEDVSFEISGGLKKGTFATNSKEISAISVESVLTNTCSFLKRAFAASIVKEINGLPCISTIFFYFFLYNAIHFCTCS